MGLLQKGSLGSLLKGGFFLSFLFWQGLGILGWKIQEVRFLLEKFWVSFFGLFFGGVFFFLWGGRGSEEGCGAERNEKFFVLFSSFLSLSSWKFYRQREFQNIFRKS